MTNLNSFEIRKMQELFCLHILEDFLLLNKYQPKGSMNSIFCTKQIENEIVEQEKYKAVQYTYLPSVFYDAYLKLATMPKDERAYFFAKIYTKTTIYTKFGIHPSTTDRVLNKFNPNNIKGILIDDDIFAELYSLCLTYYSAMYEYTSLRHFKELAVIITNTK